MVLFKSKLYYNGRSIRTVQQQINERNGSKQGRYNHITSIIHEHGAKAAFSLRSETSALSMAAGDLTANESTGSVSRDNRPTNSRAVFVSRDRLLIKSRDSVQLANLSYKRLAAAT